MIKRTLTGLMFLTMLLSGCMKETLPALPEGDSPSAESVEAEGTVRFNVGQSVSTRSSISIDENQLADVNVFAYCDGLLYAHVYSTTPETVSIKLKKGTSYNLYAVANTAQLDAPQTEDEFTSRFSIRLGTIDELGGRNLLAWSKKGYVLSSTDAVMDMQMERLYSKVHFKLDKGTLKGLEVKSVRLCQAASTVHPFMEGGSRALTAEEVMDGDYASAGDLNTLNTTGEGIHFYTLENRQGTLLPQVTDHWQKIPDNLSNGNLCTYIEVNASFRQGFFYSGNVTYRFYLGQDSTTNFDIIRNNDMSVLLTLSGDNFGEGQQNISWKVILDTGMSREGYASYELGAHLHSGNTLFVSERFELIVSLKEELYNHLDRNADNFYICAIDPVTEQKVQDVISLSELQSMTTGSEQYSFTYIGTVRKKAEWKYGLFDRRNDKLISIIDNSTTEVATDRSELPMVRVSGSPTDFKASSSRDVLINGNSVEFYVYLLDGASNNVKTMNMNRMNVIGNAATQENTCAIERSMYDGLAFGSSIKGIRSDGYTTMTYKPSTGDTPYIGTLSISFKNTPNMPQDPVCHALEGGGVKILPKGDSFANARNDYSGFGVGALPITFRAYQEEKYISNSIRNTSYFLNVDNPSCVALDFECMVTGDATANCHGVPGYPWTNDYPNKFNPCSQGGTRYEDKLIGTFIEPHSTSPSRYMFFDTFSLKSFASGEGKWNMTKPGNYTYQFNRMSSARVAIATDTYLRVTMKTSDGSCYHVSNWDIRIDPKSTPLGITTGPEGYHWEVGRKDIAYLYPAQTWKGIISSCAHMDFGTLRGDNRGLILSNPTGLPLSFSAKYSYEATYRNEHGSMPLGYERGNDCALTPVSSAKEVIIPEWDKDMYMFVQPLYKREYWHTLIHNKAGHHVIHPYPYEVDVADFRINAGVDGPKPFMYVPPVFKYQRDHIDRMAEKNDDSVYGYTVTVFWSDDQFKIYDWPAAW